MASQPLRFFSCLTLRVTVREMVDLSWSVLHLPDNMCLTRSVLEISIPIRILWLEFNFHFFYINKVNSSNDKYICIYDEISIKDIFNVFVCFHRYWLV